MKFKQGAVSMNEKMKVCAECCSEIPVQARRCRYCGSRQPRNPSILMMAFSLLMLYWVFEFIRALSFD